MLDQVADLFEAIAADRDEPRSPAVSAALQDARRLIGGARTRLEAMAGTEPIEPRSNGLLALQHTGDMIESLSRAVAAATAPTCLARARSIPASS